MISDIDPFTPLCYTGGVCFLENMKGVNLSCFEVSQDKGSFIPTFKYDAAHFTRSQE